MPPIEARVTRVYDDSGTQGRTRVELSTSNAALLPSSTSGALRSFATPMAAAPASGTAGGGTATVTTSPVKGRAPPAATAAVEAGCCETCGAAAVV